MLITSERSDCVVVKTQKKRLHLLCSEKGKFMLPVSAGKGR